MTKISQNQVKDERVVEAVRHGLEGDAAVEFIHQSGHAMTVAGIARHLRRMGGRGRVQDLIALGQSNLDILKTCFPDDDFSEFVLEPPSQQELFEEHQGVPVTVPFRSANAPLYDTTKLTLRMPSDLYEALRMAAKAENKSQHQLIVEILTTAMSRLPDDITE